MYDQALGVDDEYTKQMHAYIDDVEKTYENQRMRILVLTKMKTRLLNGDIVIAQQYKKQMLLDRIDAQIATYNQYLLIKDHKRVAHAGGIYNGYRYTNSINALEENKQYYSLFEIDFSWTSDNQLVCLHDWDGAFDRTFGTSLDGNIPTYKDFGNYIKQNTHYQNCTLESLIAWLELNPNKKIITDIKDHNTQALQYIATNYPKYIDRFIPQIYDPLNYQEIKNMGYDKIIWTLYKYPRDTDAIISSLNKMDLYALTMPLEMVHAGFGKEVKNNSKVYTYAHTINSYSSFYELKNMGIDNIYSDKLYK